MQYPQHPVTGRTGPLSFKNIRLGVINVMLFALMYMVLVGTNPMSSKVKTVPYTGDGDTLRQMWYSAVFLLILLSMQPWLQPRRLLVLPLTVTLLMAWCWLSMTWAIEPGIASRRLVLTTIVIFSAFASVRELGYDRSVATIRVMLVLLLILNYASLWITPVAIHGYEVNDPKLMGDWRGVMPQKNFAGAICVITILYFLFDARRVKLVVRAAVLAGAAYFLYRSHAKTSYGLLVLALMSAWLFLRYNPSYRAMLIPLFAIVGSVGTWLMYVRWDSVVEYYNDPSSLTGRVQIWPRLWAFCQDNWMFGAGFGSFWNIGPKSPAFVYGEGWVAGLGNGHNGYLDLLTQIGFPGLIAAVAATFIIPLVRLLSSMTISRSRGALLISLLLFCAFHNLTETSILDRDAIVEVFLMLTLALIVQATSVPSSASIAARANRRLRPSPPRSAPAPGPIMAIRPGTATDVPMAEWDRPR